MRNQLDYYGQRCEGVDTTVVVRAPAAESTRAMPVRPGAVATQPPARARSAGAYTVQVGAFAKRADADAKQRRMRAQGQAARVVRVGALWRVRVGRYASREDAARAARALKAKRIDAFVTEAESP